MSGLIGNSIIDPPYHYSVGEVVAIKFRTDREALQRVLPPVLKLPDGPAYAAVRFVRQLRTTFGPYIGVYLGGFAELNGESRLHGLSGMKTNFRGTMAGQSVWGMPLQPGDVRMEWNGGDVLHMTAGRDDVDFVRASLCLERRTEPPLDAWKQSYEIRRRSFEPDKNPNMLCAVEVSRLAETVEHWTASSTLKLVGGDPRDDWSMFPVHEVVETRYSTGGNSTLNGATLLASW